jgi:hypothetical protein
MSRRREAERNTRSTGEATTGLREARSRCRRSSARRRSTRRSSATRLCKLALVESTKATGTREARWRAGRDAGGKGEGETTRDSKVLATLEAAGATRGLWEGRTGAGRSRAVGEAEAARGLWGRAKLALLKVASAGRRRGKT